METIPFARARRLLPSWLRRPLAKATVAAILGGLAFRVVPFDFVAELHR